MSLTRTPLRYPGGKSALAGFFQRTIAATGLRDPFYAEPYCGGAGAAIDLLAREVVSDIFLNDVDPAISAFWASVREESGALSQLIRSAPLDLAEWERQRHILQHPGTYSRLELGFACFFLNRTNRSGVLDAGPIGGKRQAGAWALDARYNRENLAAKVERIARYRSRLHVTCLDAEEFLRTVVATSTRPVFTYLDPPYFKKGQCLYANYYGAADHRRLSTLLRGGSVKHWVVSYDNVPQVRRLYAGLVGLTYNLAYSASRRYHGREVMYFSPATRLPEPLNPFAGSRYRAWTGRVLGCGSSSGGPS